MTSAEEHRIRSAAAQLRSVAKYIEDLIQVEAEADLPLHQRLEYLTRARTFADAAVASPKKKTGK